MIKFTGILDLVKPEDYNNLPPLQETDFSATGIRQLLLERNRALFKKINDFNQQVLEGKIIDLPGFCTGSYKTAEKG